MSDEKNTAKKVNSNKLILIIISTIFFIIIFLSIYNILVNSGLNPPIFLTIAIFIFLYLLCLGPIFKGNLYSTLYQKFGKKTKEKKEYELIKKHDKTVNLNVKYIKPLIFKCPNCKFLCAQFMKKCPKCGQQFQRII